MGRNLMVHQIDTIPWPPSDRFLSRPKQTLASNLPAEDEPLLMLWSMTLRWYKAFTGGISEPFLRAGTIIHFGFKKMVMT